MSKEKQLLMYINTTEKAIISGEDHLDRLEDRLGDLTYEVGLLIDRGIDNQQSKAQLDALVLRIEEKKAYIKGKKEKLNRLEEEYMLL